jgi:hypothetical protein
MFHGIFHSGHGQFILVVYLNHHIDHNFTWLDYYNVVHSLSQWKALYQLPAARLHAVVRVQGGQGGALVLRWQAKGLQL